jgi:hypothetical protein
LAQHWHACFRLVPSAALRRRRGVYWEVGGIKSHRDLSDGDRTARPRRFALPPASYSGIARIRL